MSDMSKAQTAAAMYGIASNPSFPLLDRLQCALQALEFYANLDEEEDTTEEEFDKMAAEGEPVQVVCTNVPKAWNDLIEAFTMLSQHATSNRPTHCEHDEMTVCGVDPHKFTREELLRLNELGFFVSGHVGFDSNGLVDRDWDNQGTVWGCKLDYCEAHFMSFRFGSA